jgi:hypothetical protein
MGLSRLLAKGWVLVCLFAGAHALRFALQSGGDLFIVVPQVIVSVLLFAAMGLLFVGGYGASATNFRFHNLSLQNLKLPRTWPGFNEIVFLIFVVLSYLNQVLYAPHHVSGKITEGLEGALYFAVPGHAVIVDSLGECALDGGRVFASSFAWLLAIIFAGSAISRLKHTAAVIRLERAARPGALNPTAVAAVLGIAAVIGIQCVFVGSALTLLPCSAFAGVPGALLIGLSPLLLSYLIFAALAALLASGSEK